MDKLSENSPNRVSDRSGENRHSSDATFILIVMLPYLIPICFPNNSRDSDMNIGVRLFPRSAVAAFNIEFV